jgi:eukaryotic-like serine/threonine-protein kinase
MTASSPEVTIGTVLHETYEVTRQLGEGGMGTVWEARHLRLSGKRCAVKVLHGQVATDAEAFARFRREADIASKIGHPNIIEVLDWNQLPSGAPYMVLEYLDGEDLAARLSRGPLSVADALSIARQIGSALKAAHAADVVHRDLKPGNVYLLPREMGGEMIDHVKVLDFGISKMKNSQTVQTQDAVLLGTPQYMAPEQALGKNHEIDNRTDVFALGAICYEMLSGQAPFQGNTLAEVVFKVVYEPIIPLTRYVPDLDPSIAAAIDKAMAKAPGDRYADVGSFIAALTGRSLATTDRRAIGSGGMPATNVRTSVDPGTALDLPASQLRGEMQAVPSGKSSSKWIVFLVAAIVVGAGGTIGALQFVGHEKPPAPVPPVIAASQPTAPTPTPAPAINPVEPTPTPTPANAHGGKKVAAKKEDSGAHHVDAAEPPEVKSILDEAEAALKSGNGAQARLMADRSLRISKTSRAFAIITRAHCSEGDLGNAKATYSHVGAADRARVRKECSAHDIDLN